MKNEILLIFILVLCLLCTGCQKKKGIGSEKLVDTYCDLPASEIEKIAPNYRLIQGTVEKGSIFIDEKGGYGLLANTNNDKIDMLAVIYRRGVGEAKQAQMILDPRVSLYTDYSPCSESESMSEYYQLYFGKDIVAYTCVCMAKDWAKDIDSKYLENQFRNK